jgi:hypothetical protein
VKELKFRKKEQALSMDKKTRVKVDEKCILINP